ncbi:MAG TPA: NADPH-dependent F420 reductase [Anaerolineales bacterium]|nr:NADPH-dependent F420 reductase [Anaerolineales bacterium]
MTQAKHLPIIAILGGTGKEGPGLALRWAYAGYKVIIGSRQAEKAQATAAELNAQLGLESVTGVENAEAARQADISVLTVVQSAHQAALEGLKDALQGKILVDATARVDFRDPLPPEPPSAARLAQNILGAGVQVVAAFQNVPSHALKKNLGGQIATDVLVCSDVVEAAQQVIELAKAGGMQAYFAGGLDNALTVEGLTAILISVNKHYGVKTASISLSGLEPPAAA